MLNYQHVNGSVLTYVELCDVTYSNDSELLLGELLTRAMILCIPCLCVQRHKELLFL